MGFTQNRLIKAAKIKLKRIFPYLQKDEVIVDIGSGNGALVYLLKKEGFNVEPTDISNKSKFESVVPKICPGDKLPFADQSVDTVLLITMLHHTPHPEALVEEAMRVGKKIIIMEDLFTNYVQKQLTFFTDSLVNWEFKGHPHTNKNDEEWKKLFERKNLQLNHSEYYNFLLFFKQGLYVLQCL